MTSFGTRIWDPLSQERVAWDLLFIIDFCFHRDRPAAASGRLDLFRPRESPHARHFDVGAVHRSPHSSSGKLPMPSDFRSISGSRFFSSVMIAALFFLPAIRDAGFRITTAHWCQAGAVVMLAYLFACSVAHHQALLRVKNFAAANHVPIDRIAALPLPPSLLDWGGVIRSADGVYQSRFDLRDSTAPLFSFTADSPPNMYVARAMQRPEVQLYWNFARFPVIRTYSRKWPALRGFQRKSFHHAQAPGPRALFLSYSIQ